MYNSGKPILLYKKGNTLSHKISNVIVLQEGNFERTYPSFILSNMVRAFLRLSFRVVSVASCLIRSIMMSKLASFSCVRDFENSKVQTHQVVRQLDIMSAPKLYTALLPC